MPILNDIIFSLVAVGVPFLLVAAANVAVQRLVPSPRTGVALSVLIGALVWLAWLILVLLFGPSGDVTLVWSETVPYLGAALLMSFTAFAAVRLGRAGG